MKLVVVASAAGIVLCGCSTNFDAMTPGSVKEFSDSFKTKKELESSILTALQDEDRSLRYLSRGGYSCGDTKSKLLNDRLNASDPLAYVELKYSRNIDFTAAVTIVAEYGDAIDQIAKYQKASAATIDALAGAVEASTALIPGTSSFSKSVKPIAKMAVRLREAKSIFDIQRIARDYKTNIDYASNYIADQYKPLDRQAKQTYDLWDECARERLIFIRDVPLGHVIGYKSSVGLSSGIELSDAYALYRQKRRSFIDNIDLDAKLKAVKKQNDMLALNLQEFDPDAFLAAMTDLAAAVSASNDALIASDKLRAERRKQRQSGT